MRIQGRHCAAVLALVAGTDASVAWACGGCFGPNATTGAPMGVAPALVLQAGERVLFAHDPATATTRVWIEVRYQGQAKNFAWVLPVPATPTVDVGNSWLFDRLDLATTPIFRTVGASDENCHTWVEPKQADQADAGASSSPPPSSSAGGSDTAPARKPPRAESVDYSGGCGGGVAGGETAGYAVSGRATGVETGYSDAGRGADAASSASSGSGKAKGYAQTSQARTLGDGDSEVGLFEHDQVGPYDYVLIDPKDPKTLVEWLQTNGYAVPDQALGTVAAHVAKGDKFLAVRLKSGAGANEIQPIALTLHGVDPCLPLRLTAIAAVDDLSVVVFAAGPGRAIPKNLLHVVPNLARLDWLGGSGNYGQLLAAAMDEAAGRAFATEYAQAPAKVVIADSPSLQRRNLRYGSKPLFQPGPALVLPPSPFAVLGTVSAAGQLAGAMAHLPAPDAKTAPVYEKHTGLAAQASATGTEMNKEMNTVAYYQALQSGKVSPADPAAPVDGLALAAALQDAVVPATHAVATLAAIRAVQATTRLTRLAMRISPAEMTKDPVFAFDPSLPAIPQVREAEVRAVCIDGWYPANGVRVTMPKLGSWIFPAKSYALSLTKTAADPRFKDAPAALKVEVLDETGPSFVVAAAAVDLADMAMAGALPGQPSLPANLAIAHGQAWEPPPSDPTATALEYAKAALPPAFAVALLLAWAVAMVRNRRKPLRVARDTWRPLH